MTRPLRHWWVLLVFVPAACSSPTAPLVDPDWRPEGAVEFPAPDSYRRWWNEVAACLGVSADGFDLVRWWKVGTGASFYTPDFGSASGRWVRPHDIYVAGLHVGSRKIVKHEMIHEFLRGGSHDDPRFEVCAT